MIELHQLTLVIKKTRHPRRRFLRHLNILIHSAIMTSQQQMQSQTFSQMMGFLTWIWLSNTQLRRLAFS